MGQGKGLKIKTTFKSEDALHMRTAGKISVISHKFPDLEIVIKKGDRKATADSVLSLVMLDVRQGDDIEVIINSSTTVNDGITDAALKDILSIIE